MKYDRSQVMKTAHRTYKFVGKKQGKTFGEVLESTWRMAKMQVAMEENKRKAAESLKQRNGFFRNAAPSEKVSYAKYSYEDLYGTFRSGRYVGD